MRGGGASLVARIYNTRGCVGAACMHIIYIFGVRGVFCMALSCVWVMRLSTARQPPRPQMFPAVDILIGCSFKLHLAIGPATKYARKIYIVRGADPTRRAEA